MSLRGASETELCHRIGGLFSFFEGAIQIRFAGQRFVVVDDGDVFDANQAENRFEVGVLKIDARHLFAGRVAAAAARLQQKHLFAGDEAFIRGIGEGSAGAHDLVDVGFERRGNREVIHRHADHN